MVALVKLRDASGTLRAVTRIRGRDSGGTLRTVTRVRARDANNVLRIVYDPAGASSLAATASDFYPHGTTLGTGTATTNATTVTPTGGTGPYTYAWVLLDRTAPVAPTASAPTAPTTTFTQTGLAVGEFETSEWQCTVTDSLLATTSLSITASFVDVS